jgi:hypothetical protein
MSRFMLVGVSMAALLAAGCARRPDAIAPAAIPSEAYLAMACPQLKDELAAEQARLSALSVAQNNTATGDAVGVFLIGVPTSSAFGGDQEGNVAVSKGKIIAIENAISAKRC